MMYDEFLQKSGMTVTPDYYETVIQPLYMMLPGKTIKDATAFCNWIKNVGLDVADIIFLTSRNYAQMKCSDLSESKDDEHKAEMEELQAEMEELRARNNIVEDKLAVYESLFSEDEIRARLLEHLSTDDLIRARLQARGE